MDSQFTEHSFLFDTLTRAKKFGDVAVCLNSAWTCHGLELPYGVDAGTLSLMYFDNSRRIRAQGVRAVYSAKRPLVRRMNGVMVTIPSQTFLDLGRLALPLPLYVACGDHWVGNDQSRLVELKHVVNNASTRKGVLLARKAVSLVRLGSESFKESEVRVHMGLAGLPEPHINMGVYSSTHTFIARVDLSYPHLKIAIEYDGAVHLGERQRRRDAERRNALLSEGWHVVTLTQDSLSDPSQRWVSHIRQAIDARQANGIPSL